MRPLDLQVNMNAIHNVSQAEGDKIARDNVKQRDIDQKNVQDGLNKKDKVNEGEESSEADGLKDSDDKFKSRVTDEKGGSQPEQEKRPEEKAERQKPSTPKPPTEKGETSDGHIDFLA